MPIDDDMNTMLREANEAYQDFRSELSSLGMSTDDFCAAALDHVTGVATSVAVPTFKSEVNHCPTVQQWAVCTP